MEFFERVSGVRHAHGNDSENASANIDVDGKNSIIELVDCLDMIHMALMHTNRNARASTMSITQNQTMADFNLIIIGWSPSFTEEYAVPVDKLKLVNKLQESLI